MRPDTSEVTLESIVCGLAADAAARCSLPPDLADGAARATVRRLRGEVVDARLRRRARSYFWGVVRRMSVRHRLAVEVSARFVLSTVVAELTVAGRSPEAVWDEIVRGWSDKVPGAVLDEYRTRLCA